MIERALDEQFAKLSQEVEGMQSQKSIDAKSLDLVAMQLDADPDTVVDETELKDHLLQASSATLVEAFNQARETRRYHLCQGNEELIGLVVPVFEALAEADREQNEREKYHRNFGQLGYALKDKSPPDNQGAIQALSSAIEVRDRGDDKDRYRFYELNRAICKIRTEQDFESIQADLEAALTEQQKAAKCIRGDDEQYKVAPEIVEWLGENQAKLEGWLGEHNLDMKLIAQAKMAA